MGQARGAVVVEGALATRCHRVLLASGDLARRLIIARGGCVGHQKLLNGLSDVDLLIIDDFLTVGI